MLNTLMTFVLDKFITEEFMNEVNRKKFKLN